MGAPGTIMRTIMRHFMVILISSNIFMKMDVPGMPITHTRMAMPKRMDMMISLNILKTILGYGS